MNSSLSLWSQEGPWKPPSWASIFYSGGIFGSRALPEVVRFASWRVNWARHLGSWEIDTCLPAHGVLPQLLHRLSLPRLSQTMASSAAGPEQWHQSKAVLLLSSLIQVLVAFPSCLDLSQGWNVLETITPALLSFLLLVIKDHKRSSFKTTQSHYLEWHEKVPRHSSLCSLLPWAETETLPRLRIFFQAHWLWTEFTS